MWKGARGGVVIKALHYKPAGRGFDSRWCHWNFFSDIILPHILRRNCLLKQVIEGRIKVEMEVARRRGRRRKKLLDDLKDRRGYSHLKEEALDGTMWRHRFGGGFGPVVRQNTE